MNSLTAPPDEVPVTVLTGFLGAGKTTLVNRLLSQSQQVRLGVLVNEFGQLAIDAQRLAGHQEAIVELLNGCICCASQGDFAQGLNLLLERQSELDAVLIETSGLADPWPIMRALEQWRFEREVRLWSVVTVVDAEQFDANLERAEAAFQQLTAADLIVINKCDLVDPDIPARITRSIGRVNSGARTVATTNAELPLELLLERSERQLPRKDTPVHTHGGGAFQSAVVRINSPLEPLRFDTWLRSLSADVYRMKGSVQFQGDPAAMLFDRVGARCTLRAQPADQAPAERATTEIVVIGVRLNPTQLQAGLEACVA